MINTQLSELMRAEFGFEPTAEQFHAFEALAGFLLSGDGNGAFLLRGYAGTGKTSVVGALVKVLSRLKMRVVLLAPTGRAAKVFSHYAGMPAYTIHKRIYRQKSFSNEMTNFTANVNLFRHTLFIVDEASMIANEGLSGALFGTGRLLDDLIQYVYSGEGCRLLLTGDTAQLPPVGEECSPALLPEALSGYGLNVGVVELRTVVRQSDSSGILFNATRLRQMLTENVIPGLPRFRIAGFADVVRLSGEDLIEALENSYSRCGTDETVVITRSNKRAGLYNKGIRGRILGYEEELSGGDLLMIAKNNYFWVGDEPSSDTGAEPAMPFIANGDTAVVCRYRSERSLYGFRFADVQLRFPDYNDKEVEATVLLDTLNSDTAALSQQQSDELFRAVWEDYPEITVRRERMKKLKQDPYYNALQVKYSYAITCHKAQGGQWQHVYLDQGYVTDDMLTPDYLHWLYTACTRATGVLYLVNWPKGQLEEPGL